MTITAGSVTRATGFLENLLVKNFKLFGGKTGLDTFTLPHTGVVQGFAVVAFDFFMTQTAKLKVIRWSGDAPCMGCFFSVFFIIASVTDNTFHRQMKILPQKHRIHQITFVIIFRPDRGRSPRSPFPFAAYFWRHNQTFHFFSVGVAFVAASPACFGKRGYLSNFFPALMAAVAGIPGKSFFPVMAAETIFLWFVVRNRDNISAFLDLKKLQMTFFAV